MHRLLGRQRDSERSIDEGSDHTANTISGKILDIKLLYQPETPDRAHVDIVFIHGLTGDAISTWQQKGGATYWPSTLLQNDVPDARIFTFGYDADVASFWGGTSQNRLANHAEKLVGCLTGEREDTDTTERNIIFVVHSLGGLLVERALQISESNAELHLRHIESCTEGIVFLGTPHQGSDFAPFAKAVGNCLKTVGKRVNVDLLDTLKRDSQVLLDVEDWFAHWRRRRADAERSVQITCFYEELQLPGVGKVVEDFQAKIPGYSSYGIHANHMDMAKFSGADDPGYKNVRREIQRWIKKMINDRVKATVNPKGIDALNKLRDEKLTRFVANLYTCPYEDRKNLNDERVPGTCEWFTNEERFKMWNESEQSCVLWVSADPGSGKSVLARYLVDEVLPNPQRTVCYFFFKDDFPDQQTATSAIAAILHQLLLRNPCLMPDESLSQAELKPDLYVKSLARLWELLLKVAGHEDAGEVVCVLDALDECHQGEFRQVLSKIVLLYSRPTSLKLKILLTSRPYQRVQWEFQELENLNPGIHIHGEAETGIKKIMGDINLVIKSRISSIGTKRRLREDECSYLRKLLSAAPNRSYLWVTLTLKDIENMAGFTRGNVMRIVQKLPESVDDAYNRILERSVDKEAALKALKIVVAAKRPLSPREISIAMVITKGRKMYGDIKDELEPIERFRDTLRDLCGLFLVIINNGVHFHHQTAREFLVNRSRLEIPNGYVFDRERAISWKHCLTLGACHRVLAQACVSYLVSDLNHHNQTKDFAEYVFREWYTHFDESDIQSNENITRLTLKICSGLCSRAPGIPVDKQNMPKRMMGIPESLWLCRLPLILAAYLGLHQVVRLLVETSEVDVNATDEMGRTALSWASARGRANVARVLVSLERTNTAIREENGMTPLLHAAHVGLADLVALLLEPLQINAKAQSHLCPDPSHPAAVKGDSSIFNVSTTRATSGIDSSARPSIKSHADAARELLQTKDVGINARDERGNTALIVAVDRGYTETVRLLLQTKGIDANVKNKNGNTALMIAAAGHEEIVKALLVSELVDVNIRDWDGETALAWATQRRHLKIMEHILDTGQVHVKEVRAALSDVNALIDRLEGNDSRMSFEASVRELSRVEPVKLVLLRYLKKRREPSS